MHMRNRLLAAASGLAALGAACDAWAVSCAALNGTTQFATVTLAGTFGPVDVTAGDVLTITNTPILLGGVVVTLTAGSPFNIAISTGQTKTITAATTGTVNLTFIGASIVVGATSTIAFTCTSAAPPSSSSSSVAAGTQLANNANTGIVYGQQTLQSYSDWVTKSVVSSFGSSGSTTAAARSTNPAVPAATERLALEANELATEIADLGAAGADESRLAERRRRLAKLRIDLALARANAAPREATSATRPTADEASFQVQPAQGETKSPSLSLSGRDLAGFCAADACDPIDRRWNVWLEGRVLGATDSGAQTNAFGANGLAGFDYKVLPWLTSGLSVGVESYRTNFGSTGIRSNSTGVSVAPYLGARLADNIFAAAFAGLSSLTYSNNPSPSSTANFTALRFYFGGSLTGVWRDGPWRFQPTLQGAYGNETQYGYTDSVGTSVPAQTISYGRVAAGPEFGYTIRRDQVGATVEPFVSVRGALDFATNTIGVFGGTPAVVRSGTLGSGSLGLGFNLSFDSGFYARLLAGYDSIGVSGLDLWTGSLRGGVRF
jgi:hypothetical protein